MKRVAVITKVCTTYQQHSYFLSEMSQSEMSRSRSVILGAQFIIFRKQNFRDLRNSCAPAQLQIQLQLSIYDVCQLSCPQWRRLHYCGPCCLFYLILFLLCPFFVAVGLFFFFLRDLFLLPGCWLACRFLVLSAPVWPFQYALWASSKLASE